MWEAHCLLNCFGFSRSSHRSDGADHMVELPKEAADDVQHLSLLVDKERLHAVLCQHGLLAHALHGHEHAGRQLLEETRTCRSQLGRVTKAYLPKQRGVSPRSVTRASDFAERFLDHRFGAARIDAGAIRVADVTGFMRALFSGERRHRYKPS